MSKLPRLSGQDCLKALKKAGFQLRRQKGSHMILRRTDPKATVTVPDHKELDRGTLRSIIRQSGLNLDQFLSLLD